MQQQQQQQKTPPQQSNSQPYNPSLDKVNDEKKVKKKKKKKDKFNGMSVEQVSFKGKIMSRLKFDFNA